MRSVFQSQMGYAVANMLCATLERGAANQEDTVVLAGAVYFLGMVLWSHKRVETLRHSPTVVLAAFLSAIRNSPNDDALVFEARFFKIK